MIVVIDYGVGNLASVKNALDKLGVKNKEITADGMFSIEEVECLGSCATAPMMQVNNKEYYENLTNEKVDELINSFQNNHK